MIWQDVALSILELVLTIVLIPSLFNKVKPPITTSAPLAIVLMCMGMVSLTLQLNYTALGMLSTAAIWYMLWWQAIRQKKRGSS